MPSLQGSAAYCNRPRIDESWEAKVLDRDANIAPGRPQACSGEGWVLEVQAPEEESHALTRQKPMTPDMVLQVNTVDWGKAVVVHNASSRPFSNLGCPFVLVDTGLGMQPSSEQGVQESIHTANSMWMTLVHIVHVD